MSDDELREVRALLDRWSLETWGARPEAGGRLQIKEVDAAGPLQVVLRTKYEKRWVELNHKGAPAPRHKKKHEPLPPMPAVDPWAAPAEAPRDGRSWTAQSTIEGSRAVVDCPECSGSGRGPCRRCDGSGWRSNSEGSQNERCGTCRGRGEVNCLLCDGSGCAAVTPIVRIECGTAEQVKVVEDDELPVTVYLALQQATGGACVYREAAPARMEPRFGAGGAGGGAYRGDAGRHSPRVNDAVNALIAEDAVEGDFRIYGQELVVTRVEAFRVDRADGKRLWVYGDPPQVWPGTALRSAAWWARRSVPWVVALAGLAIVAVLGLLAMS